MGEPLPSASPSSHAQKWPGRRCFFSSLDQSSRACAAAGNLSLSGSAAAQWRGGGAAVGGRTCTAANLPALSNGFSSLQSALARAFALARPAGAVHVICCSEPLKHERWRRLQSGMSSVAVRPSSCAAQHAGQKQQQRRDATRPRPHIL